MQPGGLEHNFHVVLVHAHSRRKHAGANVACVGQFQEPLDGAVLAKGTVKQRKHNVHRPELQRDLVR
ncbi:hypothetical protein AHiyo4_29600 [Arthrobacter sp. Hiyo4]|nr:hypothetical protein AHiyo4_29600 [Arthrobacter sp. Hiyo4]